VAEGGAVDLAVSVDRDHGDTTTMAEVLSVGLALAPGDPVQASDLPPFTEPVELPAVAIPAGRQSATTVVRLAALANSSTTTR